MSLTTVLLRDEFSDTVAAGAVNGTLATDGVNTRLAIDVNSKMSIVSGSLSIASGGSASFDPTLIYSQTVTRQIGTVLLVKLLSMQRLDGGFLTSKTLTTSSISTSRNSRFSRESSFLYLDSPAGRQVVAALSSTNYTIFLVLTSSGEMYFVQGNEYTYPTLLFRSSLYSTASLYPFLSGVTTTSMPSSDFVRVAGYWLPSPIASHGFDSVISPTDGNGHAETSGLGSGGGGVAWSGTTWSVSGGKAINTPILGSELVANGGFETWNSATDVAGWTEGVSGTSTINQESSTIHGGTYAARIDVDGSGSDVTLDQTISTTSNTWFSLSSWLRGSASGKLLVISASASSMPTAVQSLSASYAQYVYSGRFSSTSSLVRFRRSGSNYSAYIDDVSVKPLSLSDLLSLHTSTTPDVFAGIDITVVSGTQSGLALNWDSSSSPANGVIAYHDGTNCKLEKCVAGTWTSVISAASTYSANARLVVSKIGTAYRLYYNNVLVGSGTIADSGIVSNTLHGIFSTYEGNTLDNYTCYASGTGGEYATAFDISIPATGSSAGVGDSNAVSTRKRTANGSSDGTTTQTGATSVRRGVTGSSAGAGSASGAGRANRLANGSSAGAGDANGTISVNRNVAGQSNGDSSATATLSRKRLAVGTVAGDSSAVIHNHTTEATIYSS